MLRERTRLVLSSWRQTDLGVISPRLKYSDSSSNCKRTTNSHLHRHGARMPPNDWRFATPRSNGIRKPTTTPPSGTRFIGRMDTWLIPKVPPFNASLPHRRRIFYWTTVNWHFSETDEKFGSRSVSSEELDFLLSLCCRIHSFHPSSEFEEHHPSANSKLVATDPFCMAR